jgi:hypothetical protein
MGVSGEDIESWMGALAVALVLVQVGGYSSRYSRHTWSLACQWLEPLAGPRGHRDYGEFSPLPSL